MRTIDPILRELEQEAATTRRVLQAVPEDKLGWKPHEKSMSLGTLAMHIATGPGSAAAMLTSDEFHLDPAAFNGPPPPAGTGELLAALDHSVAEAQRILGEFTDEQLFATWRVFAGERQLLAAPRIGFIRAIMLNHWYHHRGQLSVYLRLLDVPVPAIYGRSADENPFG